MSIKGGSVKYRLAVFDILYMFRIIKEKYCMMICLFGISLIIIVVHISIGERFHYINPFMRKYLAICIIGAYMMCIRKMLRSWEVHIQVHKVKMSSILVTQNMVI